MDRGSLPSCRLVDLIYPVVTRRRRPLRGNQGWIPPRLPWRRSAGADDLLTISRVFYRPGDRYPEHRHEFAEFFWIEDGALHHRFDGGERRMRPGDLARVHPDRRHALEPAPGHHCVLVNVTLHPDLLPDYRERYGDGWWHRDDRPWHHHLDGADLQALQAWVETLGDDRHSRVAVDAFVCDLLRRLERTRSTSPLDALPAWLRDGLEACAEPPLLAEGLPALVRLTGRSREYIARVLRRDLATTATACFATMRLRYAADRLRLGAESVSAIATACGVVNQTHFYRLFRDRYGCTPGAYRRRARSAAADVLP